VKSYRDQTFCECDCTNMICHLYYDQGVLKDAKDAGLPILTSDQSKGCSSYLKPKTVPADQFVDVNKMIDQEKREQ